MANPSLLTHDYLSAKESLNSFGSVSARCLSSSHGSGIQAVLVVRVNPWMFWGCSQEPGRDPPQPQPLPVPGPLP